jgi:hypothetical protein
MLDGSTLVHDQLRQQLAGAHIRDIELTGVGFFAHFGGLDACVPVESKRLVGGHVSLTVKGVKFGAGSVLFVTDGRLDFVEVFTYDDAWPDAPKVLSLDDATPIEV